MARWLARSDSNIGSPKFGSVVAAANDAPPSQLATTMVPVARQDLRELERCQKRLARYIAEAIEARESISLTSDVYRVSRQTDSGYFFANLLAELRPVEDAVSKRKEIVRLLLADDVDRPAVRIEDLEQDLEKIMYLVEQVEGRNTPPEEREEYGDKARRTMRDVEKLFKWIAGACTKMSTQMLNEIGTLVNALLEAKASEDASDTRGNDRVARNIPASARVGGTRHSNRDVTTAANFDRRQRDKEGDSSW